MVLLTLPDAGKGFSLKIIILKRNRFRPSRLNYSTSSQGWLLWILNGRQWKTYSLNCPSCPGRSGQLKGNEYGLICRKGVISSLHGDLDALAVSVVTVIMGNLLFKCSNVTKECCCLMSESANMEHRTHTKQSCIFYQHNSYSNTGALILDLTQWKRKHCLSDPALMLKEFL